MKILKSDILDMQGESGKILKVEKEGFVVACKKDSILVLKVQLEGKRVLDSTSFLLGIKGSFEIF